jgi:hypothetical protein
LVVGGLMFFRQALAQDRCEVDDVFLASGALFRGFALWWFEGAGLQAIAPERANAAPVVVRGKVPAVKANWLSKVGGYIVGIPAAAGALVKGELDNTPVAKDYIDPLTSIASDVPDWVWLAGIAGIAGVLVVISRDGEAKGVEAFQTGARR